MIHNSISGLGNWGALFLVMLCLTPGVALGLVLVLFENRLFSESRWILVRSEFNCSTRTAVQRDEHMGE